MHPDDVGLARVWTREVGSDCSDITFPNNADFQIIVEAESGATVFNTDQPDFEIGIVVKDLTHWRICPARPEGAGNSSNRPAINGRVGQADWPNLNHQFVFRVVAADLTAPGPERSNHILQVHAYLIVGAAQPNVSIAESVPFVIHSP